MKGLAAVATARDLSMWTMWLPPQRPQSNPGGRFFNLNFFFKTPQSNQGRYILEFFIFFYKILDFLFLSLANPHPTPKKKKDVTKGKKGIERVAE